MGGRVARSCDREDIGAGEGRGGEGGFRTSKPAALCFSTLKPLTYTSRCPGTLSQGAPWLSRAPCTVAHNLTSPALPPCPLYPPTLPRPLYPWPPLPCLTPAPPCPLALPCPALPPYHLPCLAVASGAPLGNAVLGLQGLPTNLLLHQVPR